MDYKDKRWRHKRTETLRRDEYLCRECRRYGKHREASTVHHIWPAGEYPQYAYCGWNLLSLCSKCHDAMHDRQTDKLTALGQQWKDKTPPPPLKQQNNAAGTEGGSSFQVRGENPGRGSRATNITRPRSETS